MRTALIAAAVGVVVMFGMAATSQFDQDDVVGLVDRLAGIEHDIADNTDDIAENAGHDVGRSEAIEGFTTRFAAVESDHAELENLVVAILNDDTSPFVFKSAEGDDPAAPVEHTISVNQRVGTHVIHACYGDTIHVIPVAPLFSKPVVYWTEPRTDSTSPHYFDEGQIVRPESWTPWFDTEERPHLWTYEKNRQFGHGTITWRDCGHVKPEPAAG